MSNETGGESKNSNVVGINPTIKLPKNRKHFGLNDAESRANDAENKVECQTEQIATLKQILGESSAEQQRLQANLDVTENSLADERKNAMDARAACSKIPALEEEVIRVTVALKSEESGNRQLLQDLIIEQRKNQDFGSRSETREQEHAALKKLLDSSRDTVELLKQELDHSRKQCTSLQALVDRWKKYEWNFQLIGWYSGLATVAALIGWVH